MRRKRAKPNPDDAPSTPLSQPPSDPRGASAPDLTSPSRDMPPPPRRQETSTGIPSSVPKHLGNQVRLVAANLRLQAHLHSLGPQDEKLVRVVAAGSQILAFNAGRDNRYSRRYGKTVEYPRFYAIRISQTPECEPLEVDFDDLPKQDGPAWCGSSKGRRRRQKGY